MAIVYNTGIVRSGLVLHLDAANVKSYPGSGTVWRDLSGRNNNATIQNGIVYNTENNGSLVFDGTSSWISINQPAVSFFPNVWTICLWLRPNSQYSRFLTPDSNGIDQWLEYDQSTQSVNVMITQSGDLNNRRLFGVTNSVPVNSWRYVCVSINNLNVKIYVNSSLTAEYNETIPIGGWTNTWRLGQRGNSTGWYSGRISNFKVYNRPLELIEVQNNFNSLRGRYGI